MIGGKLVREKFVMRYLTWFAADRPSRLAASRLAALCCEFRKF